MTLHNQSSNGIEMSAVNVGQQHCLLVGNMWWSVQNLWCPWLYGRANKYEILCVEKTLHMFILEITNITVLWYMYLIIILQFCNFRKFLYFHMTVMVCGDFNTNAMTIRHPMYTDVRLLFLWYLSVLFSYVSKDRAWKRILVLARCEIRDQKTEKDLHFSKIGQEFRWIEKEFGQNLSQSKEWKPHNIVIQCPNTPIEHLELALQSNSTQCHPHTWKKVNPEQTRVFLCVRIRHNWTY